nr:DAK2 domain-containing protein [Schaalia sp. lx-260]
MRVRWRTYALPQRINKRKLSRELKHSHSEREHVPLTAQTFCRALHIAAEETGRLARFLDDLDGWGQGDCDTGTNASRTFYAITCELERENPHTLPEALELAVHAGIRHSVGHIGILITSIFSAWNTQIKENDHSSELTPLETRRMLCAFPESPHVHITLIPAVQRVLTEAQTEIQQLGSTLPEVNELVSIFASQAQFGLVEADTAVGGRTDPGAAVITTLYACLDAAVRDDTALLHDLTRMLADLAAQGESPTPTVPIPEATRAFTVDVLLEGMEDDAAAFTRTLTALGTHYTSIGITDLFGIGIWRFHIDTSAPLAVRPRQGTIVRFQVIDSRPDELIGEDTLSDGVTHRGIRLLERRPRKRVERATVLTCTRTPGLVEDLARSGAIVLLCPDVRDKDSLVHIGYAASNGVAVLVSCDLTTLRFTQAVASDLEKMKIHTILSRSTDELTALAITRACAPVFVPQPDGKENNPLFKTILVEAIHAVSQRHAVLPVPDTSPEQALPDVLREIFTHAPTHIRLLLAQDADAALAPALRQLLEAHVSDWWPVPLEIIDGAGPSPTLIQGIQ